MRDWSDVLPSRMAIQQQSEERRKTILRACEAGMLQMDIAKALSVSRGRVSQMYRLGERRRGKPSPIEQYFAQTLADDLRNTRLGDRILSQTRGKR